MNRLVLARGEQRDGQCGSPLVVHGGKTSLKTAAIAPPLQEGTEVLTRDGRRHAHADARRAQSRAVGQTAYGAGAITAATNTLRRALALAWHLGIGGLRLIFLLASNRLMRRGASYQRAVGRTLTEVLESLGPTYIKLGQLLSMRRDILSEPITEELARLQDRLPKIRFAVVPALFRREFGKDLEEVFSELDRSPVASASIASVYRGRLRDGRWVAVKVLRPGVRECIKVDLLILRRLSELLSWLPPFGRLPLRLIVEEFGACLERQTDFRLEAEANRRVRSMLASAQNISAPTLVEELCGPSILTMQFIDGLRGTRADDGTQRGSLQSALRFLYRMIFVEGFIHCDLHRGNLHFLPGNRVVLIDFGFMAELQQGDRLKFARFFYGMATNDGPRCAQVMLETAIFSPPELDRAAFTAEVISLVRRISGAKARGFQVAGFVVELFNIQRRHGVVGTTAFMMAIVSLLVFEGLAKEIHPNLDFQREAIPSVLHALIRYADDRVPSTPPERSAASMSQPFSDQGRK